MYKNFITRFILRKNIISRVKMRINAYLRKNNKNEFDDLAFIYKLINKTPKHIFDCGANIGFVSYQFFKRFNNSKIHSFEPNVVVYEKLVGILKKESENFTFNNCGISNTNGILEFYKNNNSGTSSFMQPNDFHMAHMARKYQKIDVPIVSITDYCSKNNIDEIGILKLDIEGFELKALQGCSNFLKQEKIDFIFTEVNFVPTYQGQPLIEEIITYMRKYNYYPYNFYGINESDKRQSIITNILFISNKIAIEINTLCGKNQVFQNSRESS
ncbi:MAG: FkbM family methyltransferase [Flavobacterium sp.]|uniref:FkbM family methyltransferase n=1 Tax=Flavobacterium sp. TaxID=239 RepID=UPI003267FBEE